MKASQKCETCEGSLEIEIENDPLTKDDNEYKCSPCTVLGADYYFDTTEQKCKTCVNGTIAADGKTCTPCEGTVSLDFKTCTPCDKAGKNEYYKQSGKACTQCFGTVSSTTTCKSCESQYFFNETTLKCEYCKGVVSEDKKTCTPCQEPKPIWMDSTKTCVDCSSSSKDKFYHAPTG